MAYSFMDEPMPLEIQSDDLRSEEVQDVLSAVPNWMIRWGSTTVLLIIVMVLLITCVLKYPDIITSEAVLTTKLAPQQEKAKVAGVIDTLLVNDRQKVQANTPLAVLENTANFWDVFRLKKIVEAVSITATPFEFPLEDLPVLFLGEIETDFALFENSYDQYLLNRQLQPFSNEVLTIESSLVELESRLVKLELQQGINAHELDLKKKDLERHQLLLAEGLVSTQLFEQKKLEQLQAERVFQDRGLAISQAKEAIASAQLSAKKTEINRAKEEKVLEKRLIQSFMRLKRAIREWELKYVLKAGIAGQLSFADYWSVGRGVQAGELVFTIIPQHNTSYVAHLKTPSFNSGKIKKGQTVLIKLNNYPDTEFGLLKGKVERISVFADQEGFYDIEVELPAQLITSYGKTIGFKHDMQGLAEIITEDLRLIERFFYQFKQIIRR